MSVVPRSDAATPAGSTSSSASQTLRVGAVGYLNARPHVYGLDERPRFAVRFDVPSRCAALLHDNAIDIGLIPSIEYLRDAAKLGPRDADRYRIVPDVAIASRGPVASVVIYTTRPMADVRAIALDTSSRASVALTRVLCAREFRIHPRFESHGPDLESMLAACDAALIIGDQALFAPSTVNRQPSPVERIDLGEAWTRMTGLPFVYAFWAGRADALRADDVRTLQSARDAGVARIDEIVREYFPASPERQAIGSRYLRDNIKYCLGADERAGLELFYRYAVEAGAVQATQALRFF